MKNMPEVQIIKANEKYGDLPYRKRIERLRVGAYIRVSTEDEEQVKSYQSMIKYYSDLIKNNKEWIFVDIYADEAVTGTKSDRGDFQRLIQDCLAGKIDMVIAKSIPRFARNTLDTIKYVRMLKEKGVAVYFEVEKINTLKDGEFLLTILSSVAQQEVVNISEYVKKGLKMKMKRGELVGFHSCLGYGYCQETKEIIVNESEAETVRYIFNRYVAGAGSTVIANELNERKISTLRGNQWTSSGILGIIKNEKYKGDLLQGKTYTVDPISKRRLENLGEEDRFYIEKHHEPIISEEQFEQAQEIRKRRNGGKKAAVPGKREKFSRQYAFSCLLECGFCGDNLSRRSWHSTSKYQKTIWQCVKSTKKGKRFCPASKGIPEKVIEDAFVESYKMICNDHKDVIEEFIKRIEKALKIESTEEMIEKLKRKYSSIKSKRQKLLDNFLNETVAKDIYEETDLGLKKQMMDLNVQLESLSQQTNHEYSLDKRLKEFRKALSQNEVLEKFDRSIFESIIEKVIVGGYNVKGDRDPYKITFIYKTGLKDSFDDVKRRFVQPGIIDQVKDACSQAVDEVKNVYSQAINGAC